MDIGYSCIVKLNGYPIYVFKGDSVENVESHVNEIYDDIISTIKLVAFKTGFHLSEKGIRQDSKEYINDNYIYTVSIGYNVGLTKMFLEYLTNRLNNLLPHGR